MADTGSASAAVGAVGNVRPVPLASAAGIERRARLLTILTDAAAAGEPCPKGEDLACRLGVGRASTVTRDMRALQAAGRISLQRHGLYNIVVVTATGAQTAARAKRYREGLRDPREPSDPLDLRPRVDRDPCPYCEVRRDIGCSHTRRGLA